MSFLELRAPFVELRHLLADISPAKAEVIDLSIGAPQHAPPAFAGELMAQAIQEGGLTKYPPTQGLGELRDAISAWVKRRFNVDLASDKNILPVCGTREALFLMGLLASHRETKISNKKVIFVPDPGYQCYTAAGIGAGCEVVFLEATKENNFLPDLDFLEQALKTKYKESAVAFYLCSPANPQGSVADKTYLSRAYKLALAYDFILITDECYTELYDKKPPPSILEVAQENNFQNAIAFHSLSKRSNLPGLRSGFCAGCPTLIENFRIMRELGGGSMPIPSQKTSAKVWDDDAHVAETRSLYQKKFDLAEEFFGGFEDFYRPEGGFFLWFCLDAFKQTAPAMTKRLWQEAGVRVLPGNFLSQQNKGENYIRVALVAEQTKLKNAFERMVGIFND